MNVKSVRHTLSRVLLIESTAMLLPLLCAVIYKEKLCISVFAVCVCLSLALGLSLSYKTQKGKMMFAKEGIVSVALSWITISIIGALPFVISGCIPNYIDAVFETVSGFTTTGASILTDVEVLPRSMLFWRSFTHWLGGMGVLVFLVAIIPSSGDNNFFLMKAESPGPSVSKLVPRVKTTAKILYQIYIVFTVLEILLLIIGGMEIFDAITLSLGTAGTGGFAVKNSGLANYSSYSQIVITVFMIMFGVDFSVYYLALRRKFRLAARSDEFRTYIAIVIIATVIISINSRGCFGSLGETIKHSAFQVGSIITTTGYSTTDFNRWPELSKTILLLLMFVGACAGSTGGGIKVSRIIILLKSVIKEVRIASHPKTAFKTTMNGRIVEHETIRAVNVYMVSYTAIFALSLLVISFDSFDFITNFSAVAATINNIGPGFARVGPTQNFALFSSFSKIVLIFDMLVGRLEIFPILVLFAPHTWKK